MALFTYGNEISLPVRVAQVKYSTPLKKEKEKKEKEKKRKKEKNKNFKKKIKGVGYFTWAVRVRDLLLRGDTNPAVMVDLRTSTTLKPHLTGSKQYHHRDPLRPLHHQSHQVLLKSFVSSY